MEKRGSIHRSIEERAKKISDAIFSHPTLDKMFNEQKVPFSSNALHWNAAVPSLAEIPSGPNIAQAFIPPASPSLGLFNVKSSAGYWTGAPMDVVA